MLIKQNECSESGYNKSRPHLILVIATSIEFTNRFFGKGFPLPREMLSLLKSRDFGLSVLKSFRTYNLFEYVGLGST